MYLIIMHLQKPTLKDLVEKKSDLGKNTTLLSCNRFRWLRDKNLGLLTTETCNFMKMFKIFKMYYLALLLSSPFCYLRSWIKSLVKIMLCNHCFNLVLGAHHFSNQHDHLTPMPFCSETFVWETKYGIHSVFRCIETRRNILCPILKSSSALGSVTTEPPATKRQRIQGGKIGEQQQLHQYEHDSQRLHKASSLYLRQQQ